MKYALLDGELHIHQRESDIYLPVSLEEAQHVVDVMNLHETIKSASIAQIAPSNMLQRAEALLDNSKEAE